MAFKVKFTVSTYRIITMLTINFRLVQNLHDADTNDLVDVDQLARQLAWQIGSRILYEKGHGNNTPDFLRQLNPIYLFGRFFTILIFNFRLVENLHDADTNELVDVDQLARQLACGIVSRKLYEKRHGYNTHTFLPF